MTLDRRAFLLLAAGGALASSLPTTATQATEQSRFKAIAFDAFPIFDPRPIAALTESLFPGKGAAVINVWRTRQFEYQWLRALGGQYADFLHATEASLVFATKQLQLDLTADKRRQLMAAYTNLKVWPDAAAALETLREAGIRLVLLSNMTRPILQQSLEQSGLNAMFEAILSTDQIKSYKPDPRTYRMAMDTLELKREDILFAAFAGWDVAGAKWFGYPTFWVNRLDSPMEELGAIPDASGPDMSALVRFVLPGSRSNRETQ